MNKKPNILFAIADDASHFGLYGHDFVKTPNIDALGNSGYIFDNAFTANPKCAPSRATILTGRFPWQNEDAFLHFNVFPAHMTLYPDLLENAGYHVGMTGKGWCPGDYERNGYKHNPAGKEYNEHVLKIPDGTKINSCDYSENFKSFLSQKNEDQPFCFWYGCWEPHRPYQFGEGARLSTEKSDVKLPSYWPDTEDVRKDVLDYASEISWFDEHLGKMIETLRETGELENTIIIVTSDNGCPFPRVKGQMYDHDFHLPFIMYWEGHNHSKRIKDFINFADIAPTMLEIAGVPIPNVMTGKSFYYIFDTVKDEWVDRNRNVTYFGRERHDMGRENDLGYPVRSIRTTKYLYNRNFAPDRWPAGNPETYYPNCDSSPTKEEILKLHESGNNFYYNLAFAKRPEEELFDLENDPECMNNLAYCAEYAECKTELWNKLHEKLIETNDPRITVHPDYFEGREYIGNKQHSWKNYVEGTFVRANH